MLSIKLVTYSLFSIIFLVLLATSARYYTPPTGLNTAKPEEWEILLLGFTTPIVFRSEDMNVSTSKKIQGWEWALIGLTTTLIFNYREKRYSGPIFSMWEMKAITLAASILLTLLISPFVNSYNGELVTAFEVTQSTPLIFEVLAPISAILILQNLYSEHLIEKTNGLDDSTCEIFGFTFACLSAVIIGGFTQYIVQINPELFDPRFESTLLYLSVLILWIVDRAKYTD